MAEIVAEPGEKGRKLSAGRNNLHWADRDDSPVLKPPAAKTLMSLPQRSTLLAASLSAVTLTPAETVMRMTPDQSLAESVKQSRGAARPVRIELAAGRFELSEPLALTAADNGLTMAAAEGAKPVVAGSVQVKGWKLVDAERGLWQAEVPSVKDGKWRPRQMFVDGRRAQRARTPNEGFFRALGGLPQTKPFAFPAQADRKTHV